MSTAAILIETYTYVNTMLCAPHCSILDIHVFRVVFTVATYATRRSHAERLVDRVMVFESFKSISSSLVEASVPPFRRYFSWGILRKRSQIET